MSDAATYPAAGGPPAYRPMSAMVVIAFVLSLVFLIGCLFGFWWIEGLPILLCVFAWGAISAGRKRGTGLAIAASIIAILGGLAGFGFWRVVRAGITQGTEPLVKALVEGDRGTLTRWATKGTDVDSRLDTWAKRLEAARARVGAWKGESELGGSIWFPLAFAVAPTGFEEVEPKGTKTIVPLGAMWLRAPSERGDLWLGLVLPSDRAAYEDLQKAAKEAEKDKEKGGEKLLGEMHILEDVRLFVPAGSAAGK